LGKRDASYLFVALMGFSYLCIIVGVLTGIMPVVTLIGLGTVWFGWKAAEGALKHYNDMNQLVPVLGKNVLMILGTQALLTVGYVIAAIHGSLH
jgi:1,4-dihydroxy-2-naphthoate octaprenyltransferase